MLVEMLNTEGTKNLTRRAWLNTYERELRSMKVSKEAVDFLS